MKPDSITLNRIHDRIAELTVTNDSPMLTVKPHGDGRLHKFGVGDRPRFLMERPYSPDDAWSFDIDPAGGLTRDLPSFTGRATAEFDAFLERPLDDDGRRLLRALPTGRYALVRSSREFTVQARVLLGNELVPAPLNALVLMGEMRDSYAAAFGAIPHLKPNMAALLVGIAVLGYNGHDTMEGMWFFDLSGQLEPAVAPDEIVMVLPIEGPLVIDALSAFRDDLSRSVKRRWANERSRAFAHWCAGT